MVLITPSSRSVAGEPAPLPPAGPRAPVPAVTPVAPASAPTPAGGGVVLVPGQVIDALVLRGAGAGKPVLLQVDGKPLEARTTVSLASGQQLSLNVQRSGTETVLQLVGGEAARQAAVNEGLRLALPRQLPLPEALTTLMQAVAKQGASELPTPVHKALQGVLAAMPAADKLQVAQGLRDALSHSGMFMESQAAALPSGRPLPAGDLKAALLRLATAIRSQAEAPPRAAAEAHGKPAATPTAAPREQLPELAALGKASEGALHRIQSQQLQHIAAQTDQPGLLALEMPVRTEQRASLLKLRVQDDAHRQPDGEARTWQVVVDLDLGVAGPLQAHVTLRGGTISATLRIADAGTAAAARGQLAELEQRLQEAGLDTGSLVCVHAAPLAEADTPPGGGPLLETQA